MSINWLLLGGHQSQKREVITEQDSQKDAVITECSCPNGHTILTDKAEFHGHLGLTLKIKSKMNEKLTTVFIEILFSVFIF